MTCFSKAMRALGTILGTDWKAVIWIDKIYPWFKFISTNLAQATGNRQRKWVEIGLKEIRGMQKEGSCSSAHPALGLGNCFWGNILMQHWQPVLEYCKSMSSSCECFSNMSILSLFVSSYCPIWIKYRLSDGIPAAKVLQTPAQK